MPTRSSPRFLSLAALLVALQITARVFGSAPGTAKDRLDLRSINQEGTGRSVLSEHHLRTLQELANNQRGSTVRRFPLDKVDDIISVRDENFSGLQQSALVINETTRPTRSQHASTLAEIQPGVLLVAWFGGTWERMGDVGIWTSRFEEGSWGKPVQVAWPQPDSRNPGWMAPCWNPVLLYLPSMHTTLLFYKIGTNPEVWQGFMMRSTDGGLTWSEPRKMGAGIVGPVKNAPLVMLDGTILAGSSDEEGEWTCHTEISRDHGRTWQRQGSKLRFEEGIIQPAIFKRLDGKLGMVRPALASTSLSPHRR
jgi:hypothetical protein